MLQSIASKAKANFKARLFVTFLDTRTLLGHGSKFKFEIN